MGPGNAPAQAKGVLVTSHGQGWSGWGLLERISSSPWWAGWQWLCLVPAGPRELLTLHKCPGSTPRPLLMNQLNHSTEKLTQTHRHPSNPQKVTGRCMPGPQAVGHCHCHPSLEGPALPLPEEHSPQTQETQDLWGQGGGGGGLPLA